MAERLVGVGHLVRVFAPLDGGAEVVAGVDELGRELLAHRLAAPPAGGLDEPPDAEREPAIAADLDRDLVGGAADPTGLDLDDRRRVAQRELEDLETRPVRLRLGTGERLAEDPVGEVALPVRHQLRGEAGRRPVGRDRLVLRLAGDALTARHQRRPPTCAVALAPYLLRPCLRSRTPAASSVPRMMWYLTEGRSLTRPPRTSTTECSCRLCPMPGM